MTRSEWAIRVLCAATVATLAACGGGGSAGALPAAASNAQTTVTTQSAAAEPTGVATIDCEMFPANAIFNTRIDDASRFPAHASSDAWVSLVGAGTQLMPNWGNSSNPANVDDYWGLPFNVIDRAATLWPVVSFEGGYPDESDCATFADGSGIVRGCSRVDAGVRRFPFPAGDVLTEANDDRHVLVVDASACRLWEAFGARKVGSDWYAMSAATWDLKSNALRPDGWGSADAAGLPITPLLAKSSEASTGEIRHALRVTFRDQAIALAHVWPARFAAGGDNPGAIPFGSLLRLKSDFAIPAGWSPQAKAVALAAKRYGLYVADNGMDFFVQGEPGDGWDPAAWQQLRSITMASMEFVDTRAITTDSRWSADSMAASW
ncbi:MAG TPA: hypothetical protein VMZ74_14610 [Ramlibacter sp.]|nr:hypothetical protein [Ramlibacter sp.]